jgi:hypothetical protein
MILFGKYPKTLFGEIEIALFGFDYLIHLTWNGI